MELSNSIATMAMNMSSAKFQQNVQLSVLKKSMDSNVDLMNGLLDMMNSIPKFSGAKGSILDVRA